MSKKLIAARAAKKVPSKAPGKADRVAPPARQAAVSQTLAKLVKDVAALTDATHDVAAALARLDRRLRAVEAKLAIR